MTATITPLTAAIRDSIVARIDELGRDAAEEFAIADALDSHADTHRSVASRLQFQADELAARLDGEDGA